MMRSGLVLLVAATFSLNAAANHWPDYRGPNQNGHADGAPPLTWSETENIVWKTDIPHKGWSTPVIWGNQIWLTTATADGKTMWAIQVNLETGKIVRNDLLFENEEPEPLSNNVNCYASPSPVIEEGRVYVHFGSYGTTCIDTENGERLWTRRDLPCRHFRGPASSPVIFETLLILTMDGVDEQYLVALDKATGKTVWRTERTVDFKDLQPDGKPKGDGDFRKAYSTPLLYEWEGKPRMLSTGSKAIYSYDPGTGKEFWHLRFEQFSAAARPLVGHGMAFVNTGYSKAQFYAVPLGGQGVLPEERIAWINKVTIPKRSSPLLIGERLFMVDDKGLLHCMHALTGETVWKGRAWGHFSASPVYAAGRIYLFSEQGKTTVIAPDQELKVLAENTLDDGLMGSPAVIGNDFVIRTKSRLIRLGVR